MDESTPASPPLPPSPAIVPQDGTKEGPVPHRSNRIWLLSGLTILFLGIVVGSIGTQFLNQTPSQSAIPQTSILTPTPTLATGADLFAGWKTYTNDKFGFSLRYPSEAKTTTRDPDPFPVAVQIDNLQPCVGKACGGWLIIISETQPNPDNLTLKQWAKNKSLISDLLIQQGNQTLATETKIGEQPAIYWTTSGGDSQLAYYLIKRIQGVTLLIINPSSKNETIDQILSTFQFLEASGPTPSPTIIQTTPIQINGVDLKNIRYTLPSTWAATLNADNLHLAPKSGGGWLSLEVFNYPGTTGRREYYCQLHKYCITESAFTETTIGNISGYLATRLDNSGGGSEYFGAKGNKFYIISTYSPPAPNDFDTHVQSVLSSLIF